MRQLLGFKSLDAKRKMRETLMRGAFLVVQPTPFKKNEELDVEGIKENTRYLAEKGKGKGLVLIPTGSTGENYAMRDSELEKVVKIVVDEADGKVPVIVGVGHSGTMGAIEQAKYAQRVGADGVMGVVPYYHVPEEEGLYQHYKKLDEALNIGVLIYNNPDVSKIYVRPRLMKRIIDNIPGVIGVKENTFSIDTLYEHLKAIGNKVPIFQGRGEWWYAATAFLGVRGYVSLYGNFMPDYCVDLLKAGLNNEYAKLRDLMKKIDPYEEFMIRMAEKYGPSTTILPYPYMTSYMWMSVVKATMDVLGLHGGRTRLPLIDLNVEDRKELEKLVFEKLKANKAR